MKKYDELWHDINTLLSFQTKNLVENYYKPFGNDAPAELLQSQMDKLQKTLNEAENI
jgi:hypothetical protein